jgi:hypothetical protein
MTNFTTVSDERYTELLDIESRFIRAKGLIEQQFAADDPDDMILDFLRVELTIQTGYTTKNIKDMDGGVVSEVEYLDENGMVIGYWCHGQFDPSLPYQG